VAVVLADDRALELLGTPGVGELGVVVAVFDRPPALPLVGDEVTAVDVLVGVVNPDARSAGCLLHTGCSRLAV